MTARLYLVCGLPGAGKTTRALEIAGSTGAIRLCPDEWLEALGISLVDYDFRFKLEPQMLRHGEALLRAGVGVVVEFGSWTRTERESIRQIAVRTGAPAELHFMHASMEELVRRVRQRGGSHAEFLVDKVLLEYSNRFECPTNDEATAFDRYIGPDDTANF
jgi:predicted kinase